MSTFILKIQLWIYTKKLFLLSTNHYSLFTIHYSLSMTQDIQFTVWDKEIADIENSKLSKIQNILKDVDLPPEDLTLVTQAIFEWAQDSLLEKNLSDEENE